MRKKTINIISVILLACTLLLTGCTFPGIPSFGIKSTRQYSIEEVVDRFDISYDSGEVIVEVDNGSTIRMNETIRGLFVIPLHLSYEVKDDCLVIEEERIPLPVDLSEKILTIQIPKAYAWKECCITTQSGGIVVHDLTGECIRLQSKSGGIRGNIRGEVRSLEVNNTSGGISLETKDPVKSAVVSNTSGGIKVKMMTAEELHLSNTSGGIRLELQEDAGTVSVHGTSGGIRVTAKDIDTLEMKGRSGSLQLEAEHVGNLIMHSTSGSNKAKLKAVGDTVEMQSGSGSVTLQLPKEAGFSATITKGSGSFHCEFPTVIEDGRYLCGDGSCQLNLQAGSGSIRIRKD